MQKPDRIIRSGYAIFLYFTVRFLFRKPLGQVVNVLVGQAGIDGCVVHGRHLVIVTFFNNRYDALLVMLVADAAQGRARRALHIGGVAGDAPGLLISCHSRIFLVHDRNLFRLYGAACRQSLRPVLGRLFLTLHIFGHLPRCCHFMLIFRPGRVRQIYDGGQ